MELLLSILSMVIFESEMLIERGEAIKDLDLVNYVLANALKADKIAPENLCVVLQYLITSQAPSIYF